MYKNRSAIPIPYKGGFVNDQKDHRASYPEIAAHLPGHGDRRRKAEFYFYRDNHQNEIDLVILEDGVLHPVEIKETMNPDASDVKAFSQLRDSAYVIGTGYLVCLIDRLSKIKDGVFAIPISLI